MKHVMIDVESLATTADAVIMSIGACRFDLDTNEIEDAGFYASVSIESNLDFKRRVSEDTLIWWMKQSAEAQAVFTEPKDTLETALCNLSDWIGDRTSYIWSNGADFDLPMLAHAYTQATVEIPWEYYNSRCVRTYRALPGAKNVKVPKVGTHHNALADAIYQAQLVQAIQRMLTGPGAKVGKAVA